MATLQRTLNLRRVVLSEVVADPNDTPRYIVAGTSGGSGGKSDEIEQTGAFRQYGNQTTRLVLGAGQSRTQSFTLRALTAAQVQTVKDLIGHTVCYRDTYGRRIFGAYLQPTITNLPGSNGIADVSVTLRSVSYDEAV